MDERTQIRLGRYARRILEQIARDEASSPELLASILAELRISLFESTLTVSGLLDRCHVRSHSIQEQFRKVLGTTIGTYLLDRRMETASILLSDTRRPVSEIGYSVGYPHPGNFSRVFKKWAGEAPTSFRKRASSFPPEKETPRISHRELRRVLLGEASSKEQRCLFAHLKLAYPQQVKDCLESGLEWDLAEHVWTVIENLPFEEQKIVVGFQLSFTTPALFESLQEKRRKLGRADRRKGLELAELALHSLQSCEDCPEIMAYHTRAWSQLVVARRMMLDIPGAADALHRAELTWQSPSTVKDPLTAVIFYRSKADFRRFQRRFPEALEETDEALTYVEHIDGKEKARTLLLKATILAQYPIAGDPVPVFESVCEGLERDAQVDDYIRFVAHCNMARYCIMNEKRERAYAAITQAENVADSTPISQAHLEWLSGLCQISYSSKFRGRESCKRARSIFISQGDHEAGAMISLELALSFVEEGADSRALAELDQARSCFDSLGISREVFACKMLINHALAETSSAYDATIKDHLLRLVSK